jgi:iron complex transport system permease protein
MKKQSVRYTSLFMVTAALLLACFFWAVNTGGLQTTVPQLFKGLFLEYDETVAIILQLRFPRIIVAMLGGGVMAMSGVLMQAVMKNPLADPGIIGVTSGAAFAAVLVTGLFPSLAGLTPVFSFFGGLLAFGAVYLLAWSHETSPVRLILTGIAIDAFFTGLQQALNASLGSSYTGAAAIINANIALKDWEDVSILLICAVVSFAACMLLANRCNLLSFSDQTVMSLGVNVHRTRLIISAVSVFMASVFTAIIGAVSFLGLIVPHIARLLVGSEHKRLLPFSALLGALVFLFADTLGRAVAYPYEISAAIIMAIIGGPMLIVLLKRSGAIYGK